MVSGQLFFLFVYLYKCFSCAFKIWIYFYLVIVQPFAALRPNMCIAYECIHRLIQITR